MDRVAYKQAYDAQRSRERLLPKRLRANANLLANVARLTESRRRRRFLIAADNCRRAADRLEQLAKELQQAIEMTLKGMA